MTNTQPAFRIERPATQGYIKILLYGAWGVGKTTLAASALEVEDMRDVLFIDAESGDMSLSGLELDRVRVTTYYQVARIYDFLRLHCRLRDAGNEDKLRELQSKFLGPDVDDYTRHYKTVIVDSLTEVQKYIMYQLLDISTQGTNLDQVGDTPEFKEWGQAAEMVRLMIRAFRDLPMNIIVVCAEQEIEAGGRLVRRPALPGKLAGEVQGFLDIVGYLASRTDDNQLKRRLYMRDNPTFKAKHRFRNNDIAWMDEPTMAKLMALVNAK